MENNQTLGNKISGRILHKETGAGIPDLVVSLFDVDPQTFNPDLENIFVSPGVDLATEDFEPGTAAESRRQQGLPADRLGSVITDRNGYFELTYQDEDFRIRRKNPGQNISAAATSNPYLEIRPDLFLVVTAPEHSGVREFSNVLYRSNWARINAGRNEQYLIHLTSSELKDAGIATPFGYETPPADPLNVDNTGTTPTTEIRKVTFREQVEQSLDKRIRQRTEIREAYKKFIAEERQAAQDKKTKFLKPFSESISKVEAGIRRAANFVEADESVEDKTKRNIQKTIVAFYNENEDGKRKPKKGVIHLTDTDFRDLVGGREDQVVEFSGEEAGRFETLAIGKNPADETPTDIVFHPPLEQMCRKRSAPEQTCLAIFSNETGTPLANPDAETENESDGEKDITAYIAVQMGRVAAPEDPVSFGDQLGNLHTPNRADQEVVGGNISALHLRQGPADTPAFYDFHHVQIAFEHVWQEVFDQGLLEVAEALYDQVVDLGGEALNEPAERENDFNLQQFMAGARLVGRFFRKNTQNQVPQNVYKVFQLKIQVWQALNPSMQSALEDNADKIVEIDEAISLLNEALGINHQDGIVYMHGDRDAFGAVEALAKKMKNNTRLSAFTFAQPQSLGSFALIDRYRLLLDDIKKKKEALKEERSDLVNVSNNYIMHGQEEADEQKYFDALPSPKDLDAHELLRELETRLKEPYAFKVYAANDRERSLNFGILVTYRQRWEPQAYQAGELVKTIPLAPKESKKYSKKEVVNKKRAVKELENNLRIIKQDTADTGRAEAEIMAKAGSKSNFTQSAEGTYSFFLAEGSTQTDTTGENARESSDLKKSFRESVVKAAQEYRNERKLEITTEESFDSEYAESGEISNPNDELPVTYLFYELQRRYKIFERIHRLRPVIFVAQEMPKPHEIDEDWILTHDWVLRRALLDDSFLPALNFIGSGMTGREVALTQMRENLKLQRNIVNRLQEQLATLKNEVHRRYRLFEAAVDAQAGISSGGGGLLGLVDGIDPIGTVDRVTDFLFGDDDNSEQKEAARIRREAAMAAYEKAARDRDALIIKLESEVSSLNAATEKYTQQVSEYLNMKTQIQRFKVHLKQNILHYMQATWSYEPPDQRFFRLFQTPVPLINGAIRYKLKTAGIGTAEPLVRSRTLTGITQTAGVIPRKNTYEFEAEPDFRTNLEYATLEQAADLDNLLGFKGNYMIFPLKKSNKLTDFMMAPYLDNVLGLRDPDAFGEWTLEDFSRYVCCLKENLPTEEFDPLIPGLEEIYTRLLLNPQRHGEEITVPTGSLFIEALPGTHPILEDFKLAHRAIDVKKVQAEVREMELENIRRAARLLRGELEDPEVDKRIVVVGNGVGFNIDADS